MGSASANATSETDVRQRVKYKAFISYSHKSDLHLAADIQRALEQFAKPFYLPRALQVYRDQTDLAANPGLWPRIKEAIEESEYFLLLASPGAAGSPWVKRELDFWLSRHGGKPQALLIIWTGGNLVWNSKTGDFDWAKTDGLPRILDWEEKTQNPRSLESLFAEEPFLVDLRWAREHKDLSLENQTFQDRIATVAAELHGKPKRELIGRDLSEHRRFRRIRNLAILLLIALAITASVFAVVARRRQTEAENATKQVNANLIQANNARDNERRQRMVTIARSLRHSWDDLIRTHEDDELAALLLMEAIRFDPASQHRYDTPLLGILSRPMARVLAFSPDGFTGEPWVKPVTFSPNGKLFASECSGGGLCIWALESPAPVRYRFPVAGLHSVRFSRDGSMVAAGGDRGVAIWRLSDRKMVRRFETSFIEGNLRFSRDGSKFLAVGYNGLAVWDTAKGNILLNWFAQREGPVAGAFSKDGSAVVIVNQYAPAMRWVLANPAEPKYLDTDLSGEPVALSEDGETAIFKSGENVMFRKVKDNKLATDSTVSPLSRVTVATFGDGRLDLGGAPLAVLEDSGALSKTSGPDWLTMPDPRRYGSFATVATWAGEDWRSHTWIASGNGAIRAWSVPGPLEDELPGVLFIAAAHLGGSVQPPYFSRDAAYSPDSRQLAVAWADGSVQINSLQEPARAPIVYRKPAVFAGRGSIAWADDAQHLAILEREKMGQICVLDTHAGGIDCHPVAGLQPGEIAQAAPSPALYAVLTKAGKVVLVRWSGVPSLQEIPSVDSITAVAFSFDGSKLALGAKNGNVAIFRTDRSAPERISGFNAGQGQVLFLSFSGSGQQLVVSAGSTSETLCMAGVCGAGADSIWDLTSLTAIRIAPFSGQIGSVEFSPDFGQTASAGQTGVLFSEVGQPLSASADVMGRGVPELFAYSPDGSSLAAVNAGGVSVWPLGTKLSEAKCRMVWRNLSATEWESQIGPGVPYHCTCPQLPPGEGVSSCQTAVQ